MADDQHDYKVGRRCTPVSERGSPATLAAAAKRSSMRYSPMR
jgi:hypothetical protein